MNLHPTLLAEYGGIDTISRIILKFYDKVMETPELSGYFAKVDMRGLVDHQTRFVASVIGGPNSHSDEDLRQAHAHVGVGGRSFDLMLSLLGETLVDSGIEQSHADQIISILNSKRDLIVSDPKDP